MEKKHMKQYVAIEPYDIVTAVNSFYEVCHGSAEKSKL